MERNERLIRHKRRVGGRLPAQLEGTLGACTYYGKERGRGKPECGGERCMCEEESHVSLPFFRYRPEKEYDEYYCGCWGWE